MTEQVNESSVNEWSGKMGIGDGVSISGGVTTCHLPIIPAISVVNGSAKSVLFCHVDDETSDLANLKSFIEKELEGSCLEGCSILVHSGCEMSVVNEAEFRPIAGIGDSWHPISIKIPQDHVYCWVRQESGNVTLAWRRNGTDFIGINSSIDEPLADVTHWSELVMKPFP